VRSNSDVRLGPPVLQTVYRAILELLMPLLNPGETFPALTVMPVDAEPLALPQAFHGHFGVVLFFRGASCPYCNAQLRAFQRAGEKLVKADIRVVALSVDDEATTRELITKHGLEFPVGHSADAQAVRGATGAFLAGASHREFSRWR
jgi:peroxiredoxin